VVVELLEAKNLRPGPTRALMACTVGDAATRRLRDVLKFLTRQIPAPPPAPAPRVVGPSPATFRQGRLTTEIPNPNAEYWQAELARMRAEAWALVRRGTPSAAGAS
jgi:hypothetical protein